jgi:hypothetical protein
MKAHGIAIQLNGPRIAAEIISRLLLVRTRRERIGLAATPDAECENTAP